MAGASVKTVDMTNVKERSPFNRNRIKAGDYLATITKVEDGKTKKTEEFQYVFTIQIDKKPSSKFPYYCQLSENTLWKLRNLLIAAGISVPKSRTKVDPNKVVGRKIGVTIEDADDYNDREQSEITGVFPASELTDAVVDDSDDDDDETEDDSDDSLDDDSLDDADDSADEAEEAEDEPEEEAEDEEPEDEAADEGDEWDAITDRLELRKALKKVAPDVKTSTSMTEDDIRNLIRKHSAPKPAPKAAAAKAKPAAKKKSADVSDEELEELDLDDL